ncbi:MAG TPA: hypothetical protein VL284_17660 [Thermoanaerobaculia bacterium]|nr:hypothetical protein [Thermoanaerobaculia bacterium]
MKRSLTFAIALLVAVPMFALDGQPAPVTPTPERAERRIVVVDDVIRMAQAGVSDDAIISYIRGVRDPFEVTSDDLIALSNARVSDRVVRELQAQAAASRDTRRPATRSAVVVAPYAYGYPYYYDPFYSPLWYPRLSVGFGFVFGPRFGGGFRHHR